MFIFKQCQIFTEGVEYAWCLVLFRSILELGYCVCVDLILNIKYTRMVVSHVLISGNIISYSIPDGILLIFMIQILLEVTMTAVSSMFLIALKIRQRTIDGWIFSLSFLYEFTGYIWWWIGYYRLLKNLGFLGSAFDASFVDMRLRIADRTLVNHIIRLCLRAISL